VIKSLLKGVISESGVEFFDAMIFHFKLFFTPLEFVPKALVKEIKYNFVPHSMKPIERACEMVPVIK
jgi:hypothetical protein